ncbi:MAG: ethylbenzene dehydrogenase-related protein [Phycisphaerae bacterium]
MSGADMDPVTARGRAIFKTQCVICHGESGDGAGKFAYLMNPRPRDFRQGKFKLATTQNRIPSDEDLLRTISRGMPGSAMPPWAHLPLADLRALVKYVRQIHKDAVRDELDKGVADGTYTRQELPAELARRTQPGPPIVVPSEPLFDDLRWFRGRRIYLEACGSCHGVDGNPVPEEIKFDEEGYPVPPRSFVRGIFKGGSGGHQLYARIMKGMPGTPMPASEGNYTDDEVWDLIHYTQSLARPGSQERAQLRQGTIVAPNIHGTLPAGPREEGWHQARPLYVALTPLWWCEDRIEGLVIQALHNDEQLAIRLSWLDPTADDRAVRQTEFRDAVAIQFSLSSDPPFYMGNRGEHGGVNIWMWKADRQRDIASGYQDVDDAYPGRVADMYPEQRFHLKDMSVVEWPYGDISDHNEEFITARGAGNLVASDDIKTPVECLVARGPGTLSGKPAQQQTVQGQAVYERGIWTVQLQRNMDFAKAKGHADERIFKSGDYLPVSFAIWNGAAGDRDGKKNISIWQKLVIE